MKISACLPAYNEGRNLKKLLPRLVGQKMLDEIVVVASGCTDNTIEVARSFSPRVRTLIQERREGKSSAINLFLSECDSDIIIMESTDTIPALSTIPLMLKHFEDPKVGMVGARPIPTNNPNTTMGKVARIFWYGHHRLALSHPKLGEMVAWRNVFDKIPQTSSVDEAVIEAQITSRNLKLVYEPEAYVFNRGPETISDWVKQRKRIYMGHLHLRERGYTVSSMSPLRVLGAVLLEAPKTPKGLYALSLLCGVEIYSRMGALRAFRARSIEQTVWPVAETTKELA